MLGAFFIIQLSDSTSMAIKTTGYVFQNVVSISI
jgi:hypothetical protein